MIANKHAKQAADLDVRTAKRVASVLQAANKGEYTSLSSLQDEVKEIAVGKMNKWEKRDFLQAKWEKIGGKVVKPREGFHVKHGKIRANFERKVEKYEHEKEIGLKGDNPFKEKERLADEKRLAKKHQDPFAKSMNIQSAGRFGKDGVLTFGKKDIDKVHRMHKNSRIDGGKLADVLKRRK